MTRPRLLDLYCGAGGAAVGYHRAGFDVVGVDIEPQPRYPFEFHRADALEFPIGGYDAVHASPPCQAYSASTAHLDRSQYPDLLPPTRERLELELDVDVPWVIENVVGAPMRGDYKLCGSMFGLPGLIRHRLFETSWHGFCLIPPCVHPKPGRAVSVIGHGPHTRSAHYLERRERMLAGEPAEQWWVNLTREAMGIDWMNRDELAESIPPAYTEYIGGELLAVLKR